MAKGLWRWLGWVVVLLWFIPVVVWANLGPPSSGGQVTAEPIGIEAIEITRETLILDLRPIAQKGLAQVEVVYHLQNNGGQKKLDLLFALGTLGTEDFQVWLNDEPIASQPAPQTTLPTRWQAPDYTPGINGKPLDYYSLEVTPMALTVAFPSGKQDLKVRYAAQPAIHLLGKPTIYHQLAYILAPAKSWLVFGGLDVTIHVPPAWKVATTPTLTRQGDTLMGTFTELPSDAIALTLQAPAGWAYHPVKYGTQVLLALTWLGGLGLGWRVGRARRQRLTRQPCLSQSIWLWSLGFGLIWGMAILAVGWLAIYSPEWMLPVGQVSRYGYGQGLAILGAMGLSLLSVIVGFIVVLIAATRRQTVKELS